MSYPVQWPYGTSPEWLLQKIQKTEGLIMRSRREAEDQYLKGTGELAVLSAWGELGGELQALENGLGGSGNVSVFLLAVIHNMLSQESIDRIKLCKDLKFDNPKKALPTRSNERLSVFDLFLDNAERES